MINGGNDLLNIPARLLEVIGQHPSTKTKKFLLMTAFYVMSYAVVLPVTLVHFLYVMDDANLFVENFEALGIYTQTFSKLVIGGIKRSQLFALLEDTKQFWRIEEQPIKIKLSLKKLIQYGQRLQKVFCVMLVFVVISINMSSLFTKQLAIGIWMLPQYNSLFNMVLTVQQTLLPFIAIHTGAFDTLFMYFCVNVIIQFKMLNYRLEHLRTANVYSHEDLKRFLNNLSSYIKHHQHLLRFLENLRSFLSPVMLMVYSTQILVFCAEIYVLSESQNTERVLIVKHFITMVTASLQLTFYCVISDFILEETQAVQDAIYNSDWHSQYLPVLKTTIPIIIMRSQKEITFTAGGLYEMKSATLIAVLKLAWSVCTVIRASKEV